MTAQRARCANISVSFAARVLLLFQIMFIMASLRYVESAATWFHIHSVVVHFHSSSVNTSSA